MDASSTLRIAAEDPRRPDVVNLLRRHLAFAYDSSPPEDVHALDLDGLLQPSIAFFSARAGDGQLLGIGALKELSAAHGEIKSMHTALEARRSGVGSAILRHLIDESRRRDYERVSLETGTGDVFIPARTLYAHAGFVVCQPFAEYWNSPHSVCMTLRLR